ncbi:MAG: hypothetical protein P8X63_06850 [Desulfuromonadaceae bacterium]
MKTKLKPLSLRGSASLLPILLQKNPLLGVMRPFRRKAAPYFKTLNLNLLFFQPEVSPPPPKHLHFEENGLTCLH